MSTEKEPLLNLGNARVEAQREKMKKLLAKGKCPFCYDHLEEYHDNPIEWKNSGQFWIVTKNDYPYAPAPTQHYLLIHRDHIEDIHHLHPGAALELIHMTNDIRMRCGIEGATLMMRFGSSTFTGATVSHLHAHVICSEAKTPESKPILSLVGWTTPTAPE